MELSQQDLDVIHALVYSGQIEEARRYTLDKANDIFQPTTRPL